MKNKIILILGLVAVFSVACEKDFEEINKNPNAYTEVEPAFVFAGAVKNTLDGVFGEQSKEWFLNFSHYLTITGGEGPRYGIAATNTGGAWGHYYITILNNLKQVQKLYKGREEYNNRMQILRIWESYVYSIVVSLWGPVPLSDAFVIKTPILYDSEEMIYNYIFSSLKEAAEQLDPDGDIMKNDPVFNPADADYIQNWKRFANSLRLKLALRYINADPVQAESICREMMVMEDQLISQANHSVTMKWGLEEENLSYWHKRYRIDGNTVQYPLLSHTLFLYLRAYNDPRLEIYADTLVVPFEIEDTLIATEPDTVYRRDGVTINYTVDIGDTLLATYAVPYLGSPKTPVTMPEWDIEGESNPYSPLGSTYYFYSSMGERFFAKDLSVNIISYSEMCFIMAEVAARGWGGSKTAEEYYNQGIDANFTQWGLSLSDAETYRQTDGVRWGTSSEGLPDFRSIYYSSISDDPIEKIIKQRWIGSFFQFHDAWCLERRTRIMNFPPHFNPSSFASNDKVAEMPQRLPYFYEEEVTNTAGYASGVTALGGPDRLTTVLQFALPIPETDWASKEVLINNKVLKHWYGNTTGALKANGVKYKVNEKISD